MMTRAQQDVLLAERRGLVNRIEKMASRDLNPDEQASWDELTGKVAEIDERLIEVERELAGQAPGMDQQPQQNSLSRISMGRRSSPLSLKDGNQDSDFLRSWLRMGTPLERSEDSQAVARRGFSPGAQSVELRAMSKGTSSAGGATVPTGFLAEISKTLKLMAPVRSLARVINTESGESLRLPKNNDTGNIGEIIGENVEQNEQDLAFSEIILGAYKYSSKLVRVSRELLEDTGVDLSGFLAEQLGERIGRAQEVDFLTGNGSSAPEGVITAASTTSAASATALGVSDLINLLAAIDPAWLTNNGSVAWMMHPSIWAAIRKLNDSTGRPLVGEVTTGANLNLLGYPVVLTNGMDSTIASTKKTVLVGAFNQYAIRDVGGVQLFRDASQYFTRDQVAFVAYQRTDAKILQSGAFRVLLH
jgi:HK97 family phage major capsid protein